MRSFRVEHLPFSGLFPGFGVAVANRQKYWGHRLFCGPNLLKFAFVRLNCDHEIGRLVFRIVNLAYIHRERSKPSDSLTLRPLFFDSRYLFQQRHQERVEIKSSTVTVTAGLWQF